MAQKQNIAGDGNFSNSMRENYATHGVEKYYRQVSSSYRNPHFPAVKQCIFSWLNSWWENCFEREPAITSQTKTVFDMACGSGEVTLSFTEWWRCGMAKHAELSLGHQAVPGMPTTSRPSSKLPRPTRYPKDRIPPIPPEIPMPQMLATDPYTRSAYEERTSRTCYPLSFHDISLGKLPPLDHKNSQRDVDCNKDPVLEMVICSFALHLIDNSELFALLSTLSYEARWLIVIEPHKKPEIKDGWGWQLWNPEIWQASDDIYAITQTEILIERVHCRIYRSLNV